MSEDSPVGVEVHSAEEEVPGKQITPNHPHHAHHLTPWHTILHQDAPYYTNAAETGSTPQKNSSHIAKQNNGLHRFDTLLMKAK